MLTTLKTLKPQQRLSYIMCNKSSWHYVTRNKFVIMTICSEFFISNLSILWSLFYKEALTWIWFRNVWEAHDVTNALNDKYFRGSDSKCMEVRKTQAGHNSGVVGVQHCHTSRAQSHQIKATPGHHSPWVSVPRCIPSHTWRRVQRVNVLVRPP